MYCTPCFVSKQEKYQTILSLVIQIRPLCHLVVRLSEVVEAGDVFQEHTKLCRQVFEHQAMVIRVLQLPNMFLGMNKHTRLSHLITYSYPDRAA